MQTFAVASSSNSENDSHSQRFPLFVCFNVSTDFSFLMERESYENRQRNWKSKSIFLSFRKNSSTKCFMNTETATLKMKTMKNEMFYFAESQFQKWGKGFSHSLFNTKICEFKENVSDHFCGFQSLRVSFWKSIVSALRCFREFRLPHRSPKVRILQVFSMFLHFAPKPPF